MFDINANSMFPTIFPLYLLLTHIIFHHIYLSLFHSFSMSPFYIPIFIFFSFKPPSLFTPFPISFLLSCSPYLYFYLSSPFPIQPYIFISTSCSLSLSHSFSISSYLSLTHTLSLISFIFPYISLFLSPSLPPSLSTPPFISSYITLSSPSSLISPFSMPFCIPFHLPPSHFNLYWTHAWYYNSCKFIMRMHY